MKALVIVEPGRAEIREVPTPTAGAGEVVVAVGRAGVCGTDMEFYTGEMAYLHSGHEHYPVRIGHEWMGTVRSVGDGVAADLLGRRVTGDTMLGCGRCRRCMRGRQHVCDDRFELGIRGGRPGALAEYVAVPATSLHLLPDAVDDAAGALVEPGGNAYRAAAAAEISAGDRVLVTGSGTIGLLCAMFARGHGAEVHLLGRDPRSLAFARGLGFAHTWTIDDLPAGPWDAVIEASNSPELPPMALDLVEPGGRVVYIGVAGRPSMVDTRDLVLRDVTAVGVLSASPGLAATIESYAAGTVDPRGLVAATVSLDEMPDVIAGRRPAGAGDGPKVHAVMVSG